MPPKKPPLGTGRRFAAIERQAKASGADDPGAVAYSVGVKKYGKERMAELAAKGRRRK